MRLLTPTGRGGSGKTRLALHAAVDLLDYFPGGIYFVPLAPISKLPLVVSAIASALGVWESGNIPLLERARGHEKGVGVSPLGIPRRRA